MPFLNGEEPLQSKDGEPNSATTARVGRSDRAPKGWLSIDHSQLYERLRHLGADRLAHLVAAIAESGASDVRRLIGHALEEHKGATATASPAAEEGEPFMAGASAAMQQVFASIRKFAASDAPVLVTGESGTGKELVGRAIHERSAYAKGPFVAINCAALPATLIAAELFGYEKGAFTGATGRRIGRLESANGGTVFLDEIGDLPVEQQSHLLRFLQEGTVDRVGGTRPVPVKTRVIAATNSDLRNAVEEGRFREDLFFRLNVLTLQLPPLRERGGDIELLANLFLRKFSREQGRTIAGFTSDAWAKLREHDWPGNVRELISCIRRAVVVAEGPWIGAKDFGLEENGLRQRPPDPVGKPRRRTVIDEGSVRAALSAQDGNVTRSARALGISRMTLYRLMRRFGINGAVT